MNIPVYTTARIHAGINRSYCMTEKLSSSVRYLGKARAYDAGRFSHRIFLKCHTMERTMGVLCIEIDGKVFSFLTDLGEIYSYSCSLYQ